MVPLAESLVWSPNETTCRVTLSCPHRMPPSAVLTVLYALYCAVELEGSDLLISCERKVSCDVSYTIRCLQQRCAVQETEIAFKGRAKM